MSLKKYKILNSSVAKNGLRYFLLKNPDVHMTGPKSKPSKQTTQGMIVLLPEF
jgi:hypothetical protein